MLSPLLFPSPVDIIKDNVWQSLMNEIFCACDVVLRSEGREIERKVFEMKRDV